MRRMFLLVVVAALIAAMLAIGGGTPVAIAAKAGGAALVPGQTVPLTKDICKDRFPHGGGPFDNQGDCIQVAKDGATITPGGNPDGSDLIAINGTEA